MKVEYSRQFMKASYKLSGKYITSLQKIISEIKSTRNVSDVTDCIKLAGYLHTYRIKMGDYRMIFTMKEEDTAVFQLLLSRGDIYKKGNEEQLRRKDRL